MKKLVIKKPLLIISLTICLVFVFLSMFINLEGINTKKSNSLTKTHAVISKKYKNVPHLRSNDFINMDESSYVIFDVREKDEYAVSHIKNAIRVDPSIDATTFYQRFGEQIIDKKLILYCSVGARSTQLANKLMTSTHEENEFKVYNLENGIFGWHNESLPLFQSSEQTEFVHPYNSIWGLMVNRKNLRRYNP